MVDRIFGNFFKDNDKIKKFITSNHTEAVSIALGYHLSRKKSILITSKSILLNSIAHLNDLKLKEIPLPIFIGEQFTLFKEPITELKIRKVLRSIGIPFFIIRKQSRLKKIADIISFTEILNCPAVFCVSNNLWRK